ncbi:MAG: hypothetical protein WCJ56_06715 [bacterium]
MNHQLGDYEYALNPTAGGFTGVQPALSRVDVPTYTGNISLWWPAVWGDTEVREEWEQMTAAQYAALRAKYLQDGGGVLYTWSPGEGNQYTVEITALTGRPYKGGTYVGVVMRMKVHGRVSSS